MTPMLSMLLAVTPAAAARIDGPLLVGPLVSQLSASSFAVEQGGPGVHITGSGFGAAAAAGALCRITSRSLGDWASGDFTYSGENPAVPHPNSSNPSNMYPGAAAVVFNATVISDTLLYCTPPAVIVNGPGLLAVRNANGKWSTGVPVEYVQLFDIAIGRRPYITERTGHLLLRCNASLLGASVMVEATLPELPAASRGWRWNVTLNGSNVLEFSFGAALPATVNADIQIVLRRAGAALATKYRRFMRCPHPPAGVVPTQVDHFRRGLLVGGQPHVGVGWYFHTGTIEGGNFSAVLASLARQSLLGDNQLMPISFFALEPANQKFFLDTCERLGLKVMIPLSWSAGGVYQPFSTDSKQLAWLQGNITAVMNHSCVLGYCECSAAAHTMMQSCAPAFGITFCACCSCVPD